MVEKGYKKESKKNKEKKGQAESKDLEITLTEPTIFGEKEMQNLLSKKDELVKQKTKDGRNKYQVEVNKLKKRLKEYNKTKANKDLAFGEGGIIKFGALLRDVQKKEKQGKFDRGAEGKAKNAVRKKMMQAKDSSRSGGVHAGTYKDEENELIQNVGPDPRKKKKKKTGPGSR